MITSNDPLFLLIKRTLQETKEKLLHSTNDVLQNTGNIKTQADFIAQEVIINALKENNISCRIFSEELDEPMLLGDAEYDIVMDPVDNSYLFVKGILDFSSIAVSVLKNKQVVYAFVQSLGKDELYYCDENNAYVNDRQLHVESKEPCLIAGYAARKEKFTEINKLEKLSLPFYYLNTGGPLLSAMVASNHFSAAVEFIPASFYEAAGALIAQKAGAFVETIDGKPLVLDPEVKQTMITANSRELLKEIQKAFQL